MRLPAIVGRHLPPRLSLAWYPPFRAMRVRVLELSDDWRRVRISLPLARNRNPGGGMFGGAMACLADPIAALACNRRFPGHRVWTRELTLDFIREGRSDMQLRFEFGLEQAASIAAELANRGRATPSFEYGFYDDRDRRCVTVHCRVAIRPGDYRPAGGPARRQE